jgi:hypothetical protein
MATVKGARAVPSAPPAKGGYGGYGQLNSENVPDVELGAQDEALDAHMHRQLRLGFIRKVYGILTCQLALTTIMCSVLALNGTCRRFVMATPSLMYIGMFGSLGVLFALMAYKDQHPLNAQLLFVWTVMEAYTVGVVCASYTAAGQGRIVIEALVLTLSVFGILTLYTFQSKRDWSFLGAGLSSALWLLIGWSLFSAIFGAPAGGVYSLLGALVFSGYIIFDTFLITQKLGYDDHILASVMLYLDLLNLFLFILRLLSRDQR